MDLGECMKVHDLALRADYEIASKEHEYFFELDVSFSYTHPGSLFVLNFQELLFFPSHSYKNLFYSNNGYPSFKIFGFKIYW